MPDDNYDSTLRDRVLAALGIQIIESKDHHVADGDGGYWQTIGMYRSIEPRGDIIEGFQHGPSDDDSTWAVTKRQFEAADVRVFVVRPRGEATDA